MLLTSHATYFLIYFVNQCSVMMSSCLCISVFTPPPKKKKKLFNLMTDVPETWYEQNATTCASEIIAISNANITT